MSHGQPHWRQYCPIGSHLNFFAESHQKLQKNVFFTFGQFTRVFGIGTQIRGTTMSKLTSWGFQKCHTFWVWESPQGSYCCSKSTDFEILGPLAKLRGVTKKSHGQNFDFLGLKRIGYVTNRVDQTCYSFQPRKIKIVAVTFFCDAAFCFPKKIEKLLDFDSQ